MVNNEQPEDFVLTKQYELEPQMLEQLSLVYHDSFPTSERVPFYQLVNDIAHKKRWLFTVQQFNSLIGFAIVLPLANTDVHYLEYIAIHKAYRKQGLGGKLLQNIITMLDVSENIKGIIFEIETDDVGAKEQKEIRRKRLEFYLKNGARVIKSAPNYCMPSFEDRGSIRMKLMWHPLINNSNTLSAQQLKECICRIYQQSYGRSLNDSLLQKVLKELISEGLPS